MEIDWAVLLAFTKPTLTFLGAAAWPISAAFIALRFREPISSAIARAKRFSAFGIEADLPLQQQAGAKAESGTELLSSSRTATVSPEPLPDAVLDPIEGNLVAMIEQEPLTVEQKLKWAIRIASQQAVLARHEQHYRLIYGSQLAFLRHLNVSIVAPEVNARYFYDTYGAKPPPSPTYTYENWLAYLVNAGDLESFKGEDGADMFRLTPMGKAFLIWATNQSVPDKPL